MARILSHAAAHVDAPAKSAGSGRESELTKRELEIREAVAQGKRGKEIAAELHIADWTVRALDRCLLQKTSGKAPVNHPGDEPPCLVGAG